MEELIHEDEIPVGRAEDLRGQKYNRLTVKYRVKNLGKQTAWLCICDFPHIQAKPCIRLCSCGYRRLKSIWFLHNRLFP